MHNDKFTVVIPTMWKYAPFIKFLADLIECDDVHQVIIIDNNPAERPPNTLVDNWKVALANIPIISGLILRGI